MPLGRGRAAHRGRVVRADEDTRQAAAADGSEHRADLDTSNFSVSPAGAENTCEGQTLAASDTCIVVAHFNTAGSGPKQADLTVKSDVSADGEAVAKLTGTA